MQCENCTRPAEYRIRAYAFCLTCARRFLGYTPDESEQIKTASLPTEPSTHELGLEDTQWTIATIEPGTLFKADGVYAVKSEYHLAHGTCMCILLASGEYGYFSQGDDTPCEVLDVADASQQIDELRDTLERQSRDYAQMRAALVEAQQQITRGQILDAQAAIRRGLGE
jgi:hypothetical protein